MLHSSKGLLAAKLGLISAMMTFATPAVASDFSGLIYFFYAAFAIGMSFVCMILYFVRQAYGPAGPGLDMVTAAVLALCIAPVLNLDFYADGLLLIWPMGLLFMLGGSFSEYGLVALFSWPITFALIYFVLRRRRMRRSDEVGS